jgi:hypothetical protein
MSNRRIGLIVGITIALAATGPAAAIWAMGGMFYQRCDRMFPKEPIKADRCTGLLARGMDKEARAQ